MRSCARFNPVGDLAVAIGSNLADGRHQPETSPQFTRNDGRVPVDFEKRGINHCAPARPRCWSSTHSTSRRPFGMAFSSAIAAPSSGDGGSCASMQATVVDRPGRSDRNSPLNSSGCETKLARATGSSKRISWGTICPIFKAKRRPQWTASSSVAKVHSCVFETWDFGTPGRSEGRGELGSRNATSSGGSIRFRSRKGTVFHIANWRTTKPLKEVPSWLGKDADINKKCGRQAGQ